jgi:hypothetical protein
MPPVVATPAALIAALKAAGAGAVILLAPGKWPEPVVIYGMKFPGGVTLRSEDPAHPAVLSSLIINRSEGIEVSDLTLATELYNAPTSTQAAFPFRVMGSRRISLTRLNIHGTLDDNPQDDVNGPLITDSQEISVTHCEFQQFYNALGELRNDHVLIADNNFHDIRNDGIDNGGTSNITVTNNHFTDFYPVGAVGSTGDHADAIQFWTTRTTTPAHDITITHNTFVRGHGSWIQGVFVNNEASITYQHIVITDNVIEGGEYNGIMVLNCNDLTLTGNTVKPYSDLNSWIRVEKCTDVKMRDNRSGTYFLRNNARMEEKRDKQVDAPAPPFRMRKITSDKDKD